MPHATLESLQDLLFREMICKKICMCGTTLSHATIQSMHHCFFRTKIYKCDSTNVSCNPFVISAQWFLFRLSPKFESIQKDIRPEFSPLINLLLYSFSLTIIMSLPTYNSPNQTPSEIDSVLGPDDDYQTESLDNEAKPCLAFQPHLDPEPLLVFQPALASLSKDAKPYWTFKPLRAPEPLLAFQPPLAFQPALACNNSSPPNPPGMVNTISTTSKCLFKPKRIIANNRLAFNYTIHNILNINLDIISAIERMKTEMEELKKEVQKSRKEIDELKKDKEKKKGLKRSFL